MKEALVYFKEGMDPAGLVTHIGGIDAVIDTTLNLPNIPGGKKLIYNHINMPLTAIADFSINDILVFFNQTKNSSICLSIIAGLAGTNEAPST